MHEGAPFQHEITRIRESCLPCAMDWAQRLLCESARPTNINLPHFFVWALLKRFLYEPVVEGGDKLLRIQAACDSIIIPVFSGECDIQSWIAASCAMKSVVVVTYCTFVVAVLLILKCLIILIVCQCYLCTIKVFPANYVWRLQSRFETSFLPLKKTLQAIQHYLRQDIKTLPIFCPSIRPYLPAVHSCACISVMTKHVEPGTASRTRKCKQ